jgi:hypothetical protein
MRDVISEAANSALEGIFNTPAPDANLETSVAVSPDASDDSSTEEEEESAPVEPIALPEGYVTVPTLDAGLATDFAMFDAEGAVEVPALEVEYKANGKVRRDRLDQVVKLAQMGVYNYQREVEREADTTSKIHAAEQETQVREEQLQRLLEDEDLYIAARERYLQANTPEVRNQRLVEENTRLKTEQSSASVRVQAERFYSAEVLPSLQAIVQALPEVSEDELGAYLATAAMPLMENGMVAPRHYDALRTYIVEELTPWAQRINQTRAAKIHQATAAVSKKVEAAQVSAQKAKREVGKMVKPTHRTVASADKPRKPNGSVDDAVNDALSHVLSHI